MKGRNLAYLPERLQGKRNISAVRSFVPKGRSEFVIYAVALSEHPGVVKVGRSAKWKARRKAYESWNLAPGNAIEQERAFIVTEEFVDLPKLEDAILEAIPFPQRHGREWFVADFDEVCRLIERFLCEHEISYI